MITDTNGTVQHHEDTIVGIRVVVATGAGTETHEGSEAFPVIRFDGSANTGVRWESSPGRVACVWQYRHTRAALIVL